MSERLAHPKPVAGSAIGALRVRLRHIRVANERLAQAHLLLRADNARRVTDVALACPADAPEGWKRPGGWDVMPTWDDLVIYELHVGTFARGDERGGDFDEAAQEFLLRHFVEVVLLGVSNEALETHLAACMGRPVAVVGNEPPLEACPCCGFLTLSQRGEYDICPVCTWEDDGKGAHDPSLYSAPNRGSLQDVRVRVSERIESRGRWYRRARMPEGRLD